MGEQPAYISLFKPVVNPINLKCTTLPILSLNNQYSRNFHLAWLGFFVAFLSWFAFSPLIPDAIRSDLHLTPAQVGNSNVVSLCATLIVRIIVGPLVDKYGPRRIMAAMLIIGAIPSGLAGTISTASGLYVVRFFIGILGGTFVTCQAWTTAFFDKNVVGRANALAGGWGNSGGGFTFIIMIALFNRLLADGLSSHVAWRASFAIVPVPILFFVAILTLVFGTDHPAGKWSDRHKLPIAHRKLDEEQVAQNDQEMVKQEVNANAEKVSRRDAQVTVAPVGDEPIISELDVAVNKDLTWDVAYSTLVNPLTWLPALGYLTTFGYELAIDANLGNVLYNLYKSPSFGQTKAGYIAGAYGLINIVTRPFGGYLGDLIYRRYGVPGKKYLTIFCGIAQGLLSAGLGVYIDGRTHPSLAIVIVLFLLTAVFNEGGNGANFALVPHCNPNSNGLMTGIVGATGNLGGVIFALIFRFQPLPYGKAFWVSGILTIGVNLVISFVPVPAL
ncbi:nitrate transporter [Heliocybe sulcata]|uniref:Nitrate/nitrite transporter n=1 Tax=Heliocybe sulcata TaxID=5364 RepID=A0A5C3N302_9AGAM|nr:nitrate transporter [Heliocybe sulcata]